MTTPTDPYFWEALARHVGSYRTHFGDRLLAVYVWGSVHRGEAVRGVSDMDIHAFVSGDLGDDAWYAAARATMDVEYPGLAALSRPLSASLLTGATKPVARALGFRLRYDATRVFGDELVTDAIVPVPDKAFASGGFESVRDLARFAAGADATNKTDFDLPQEPGTRLRKLARLAVLGGAYLSMARARFVSFRGTDVLPAMREEMPEHTSLWDDTERLYVIVSPTTPDEIADYQARLLTFLDTVNAELSNA